MITMKRHDLRGNVAKSLEKSWMIPEFVSIDKTLKDQKALNKDGMFLFCIFDITFPRKFYKIK